MAEVRDTSKPNSMDRADWGELDTSGPEASAAPPSSDQDSYAQEPWNIDAVGAQDNSESHNSEGMVRK